MKTNPVIGRLYEIWVNVAPNQAVAWAGKGQINTIKLRDLYLRWSDLLGEYVVPLRQIEGRIYRVRGIRHNILFNLNVDYIRPTSPLVELAASANPKFWDSDEE